MRDRRALFLPIDPQESETGSLGNKRVEFWIGRLPIIHNLIDRLCNGISVVPFQVFGECIRNITSFAISFATVSTTPHD